MLKCTVMERVRPSRGESIRRREALAESRRERASERPVLTVEEKDRKRLGEIEELLGGELSDQDRASLMIEKIWWNFKLERISADERTSMLQRVLNQLKKKSPPLYNWLNAEKNGVSPLAEIRNKVYPPVKVGGYYTKRY